MGLGLEVGEGGAALSMVLLGLGKFFFGLLDLGVEGLELGLDLSQFVPGLGKFLGKSLDLGFVLVDGFESGLSGTVFCF